MKITYLVDFFRTINAGTEKQLSYLLTHLPEAGYSVQLISLQDSPFLEKEAPLLFSSVTIKTLGVQSDISKSLPELAGLFFLLRSSKPAIVHTFFPASNSFGVLVARLAGIKTIVSSRRDLGFNLTRRELAILKLVNRLVSCVLTNSRAVQNRAIQLEGISMSKTRVIHNGISLEGGSQLPHKMAAKEAIVGIVANLNRPVKRVDLFIKAGALVHKEFPHVKFWVFGDGPLRKDLETLASSLGLNSSVVFMGHRGDVQQHLKAMSVGVICSDSEGFSNAIMEYMAAGLPVLATDVGGNPELVCQDKTGILVPPNNADALAKALKRLLIDREMACKMGNAAQKFLRRSFPIDGMIQKTKEVYESFLV